MHRLITAAAATHTTHVTVNPHAALLVGAVVGAWLLVLRIKSRFARGRLSRAVTRSMALSSTRAQTKALGSTRMLNRAARSRRATWRFRKAVAISALIAAAYVFVHLHPHTH